MNRTYGLLIREDVYTKSRDFRGQVTPITINLNNSKS